MKAIALREITNWDVSVWAKHEEPRTVLFEEGTTLGVVSPADEDGDLGVVFPGNSEWHFVPADLFKLVEDGEVKLIWEQRQPQQWVAFYHGLGGLYECDIYGAGGFSAYVVQAPCQRGVIVAPSGSIFTLEEAQDWCTKTVAGLVTGSELPCNVKLPF